MAACRMASHCWRSWRPRHTAWMRQVADVRTRARRLSSAADAPARRNTCVYLLETESVCVSMEGWRERVREREGERERGGERGGERERERMRCLLSAADAPACGNTSMFV
eukprot:1158890-Pelagomonas_calceolata.AAC.6